MQIVALLTASEVLRYLHNEFFIRNNWGNQTAMEMGFELNKNASVKCQPTTTQGFQSKTTRITNLNPSYASKSILQKKRDGQDGFE
jgi:hypothetical protein